MAYKEEMCASGKTALSKNTFGEVLTRVLGIRKKNKRLGKVFTKVYSGVKWRTQEQQQPSLSLEILIKMLPKNALLNGNESSYTAMLPSAHIVNGQELYRQICFQTDGQWSLAVLGQTVDIVHLGFHNYVKPNLIPALIKVIQLLPFCHGKERPQVVTVSELLSESWVIPGNNHPINRIRTPKCDRLVGLTAHHISHTSEERVLPSCRQCQRITVHTPLPHYNIELTKEDDQDMAVILDKVLPNAAQQCKALLMDQKSAHDAKSSKGHRWSKEVIQMCLTLYTRSPGAYHDLVHGGSLKLPSGRLLSMYKNAAPQETGKLYHQMSKMKIIVKQDVRFRLQHGLL